jgi:hypothetical protein
MSGSSLVYFLALQSFSLSFALNSIFSRTSRILSLSFTLISGSCLVNFLARANERENDCSARKYTRLDPDIKVKERDKMRLVRENIEFRANEREKDCRYFLVLVASYLFLLL